eukprot:1451523-Alexandrium_andersonii.AAC.1
MAQVGAQVHPQALPGLMGRVAHHTHHRATFALSRREHERLLVGQGDDSAAGGSSEGVRG